MVSPTRRTVLAGLLTVGGGSLSGCGRFDSYVDRSNGSDRTTTFTPERRDNLYIENFTSQTRSVTVAVYESTLENADMILGGAYEIAGNQGVVIEDLVTPGTVYRIEVKTDTGKTASFKWGVHSCIDTPNPDGNMDAGIQIRSSGVTIVQNECDFVKTGYKFDRYRPVSENDTED